MGMSLLRILDRKIKLFLGKRNKNVIMWIYFKSIIFKSFVLMFLFGRFLIKYVIFRVWVIWFFSIFFKRLWIINYILNKIIV